MKFKAFSYISRLLGYNKHDQSVEKRADYIQTIPATEEFERCVICGTTTQIPISMPIEFRDFYVSGCGQLCVACATKRPQVSNRESALTDDLIMLAVVKSRTQNEEE